MKLYYVTMYSDEEERDVMDSFSCFCIAENIKEAKRLLLHHQDSMEIISDYENWFCDIRIKTNKDKKVNIEGLNKGCYLYELNTEELLRRRIYTSIYDYDKEKWIEYEDLFGDEE